MTLKLENIILDFGAKRILDAITFDVQDGEFVCLLGPSGCGKTSTLRICAGLESPTQGQVMIDQTVMSDSQTLLPPEKRNLGFLFQDFALFPHLSVFDNVAFGLKAMSAAQKTSRVREVLQQVQMQDYERAMPHTLSGGQQQRIALARALAPKPRMMLLDEPFSGLDSGLRAEMRDMTLHVLKNNKIAAVMVTHDPEEAMFMADRIILMKAGKIIQNGTPFDLYKTPVNHFAASFFGEINTFKGEVRNDQAITAFGSIPITGFQEGDKVDVLVRPEDIYITCDAPSTQDGAQTVVEAVRYLGRNTLLHLHYKEHSEDVHFHVRTHKDHALRLGDTVISSFAPEKAYVFLAH